MQLKVLFLSLKGVRKMTKFAQKVSAFGALTMGFIAAAHAELPASVGAAVT